MQKKYLFGTLAIMLGLIGGVQYHRYNSPSAGASDIQQELSHSYSNHVFNHSLTSQQMRLSHRLGHIEQRFAEQRMSYHYPMISQNTRDLGGYTTNDDEYQIKPRRLIRSNDLTGLNKQGVQKLHRLHVDRIIDLRDSKEIRRQPDPGELVPHHHNEAYEDGINMHIPVTDDDIYTVKAFHDTKPDVKEYGSTYRYRTIYDMSPTAIRGYRRAVHTILHNRHGAVLYHCIQGRDRTGLLSVILLSALNIKRSTIYKDYLLTDYYHHTKPYIVQYDQLTTFFKTADQKYGSLNGYLARVGLNKKAIHQLRKMYLKPAD